MNTNGSRAAAEPGGAEAPEDELVRVLDAYLAAVDAGRPPDPEQLIAEHPRIADRLRDCLGVFGLAERLAGDPEEDLPPDPGLRATQLGDFRLVRPIGRGGMGVVYEAEQISLRRRVALKVMPYAAALDPRQLQRFQLEAHAAACLHHTNIVPVHAVGTERGVPFYAMQFIVGHSLAEVIDDLRRLEGLVPKNGAAPDLAGISTTTLAGQLLTGSRGERPAGREDSTGEAPDSPAPPVPPADRRARKEPKAASLGTTSSTRTRDYFRNVARLGLQAAEALDHAHTRGILHRDIKPANLLLGADGHLWVTDFGLAQVQGSPGLTLTGDVLGTLRYMSPEQALGGRVVIDGRTDVYSLGVTLYELLTLRPAFDGRDRAEILRRIAEEGLTPLRRLNPAVPSDLQTIVHKALARDPSERYGTARDLALDLGRFLESRPIRARPPSLLDRYLKWARRHAALTLFAASTLIVILLTTTVASVLVASKERERGAAAVAVQDREKLLRKQAEEFAEESRRRQVQLSAEQGTRLMNDGDLAGSLPYFVEALRLDGGVPSRVEEHRLRLGSVLTHCAKPARIWFADEPVTATAFALDGRGVAVALGRGTVRVWNATTGEPLGPALEHPGRVSSLDFSPDGRRIATAGSHAARIWDIGTGQEVVPPLEHQADVLRVSYSTDGRLVLSLRQPMDGNGLSCRVWDADTGRPVSDWLAFSGAREARFSPDGRSLAVIEGQSLRIYNSRTGRPASPPMGHNHNVRLAPLRSFSPDGRRIVTGGLDRTVRIWNTTTGKLTAPAMNHFHWNAAAFSPDGHWVLSWSWAGDNTARMWNAATGAQRCDPMRHPDALNYAEFSPDGTRLATVCKDRGVRIWDAETGSPILPPLWHTTPVTTIRFSLDGRTLLAATEDGVVRLWDLASASPAGHRLPDPGATFAQFSPDSRLVVTHSAGRSGGKARVWEAETGAPVGRPLSSPATWLRAGAFSPDGRSFAAMGPTGGGRIDAWIWDLETRKVRVALLAHRLKQVGDRPILAWSPDGHRIATAAGSSHSGASGDFVVRIWDTQTGKPVTPALRYDTTVFNLDFSPDGRFLLIATGMSAVPSRPGEARILDASTGVLSHPPITAPWPCMAARFSSDGRRFVTAGPGSSFEGGVRVWDAATGRPLTPPLRHPGAAVDAFFSPDGLLVASVGDAVQLWDATTGAPVRDALRLPQPPGIACFSPDSRRLLVGCGSSAVFANSPGFALVMDLATGQPLTPFLWRENYIINARFSPDGRRIVTTCSRGALLEGLLPDKRPLGALSRMAVVLSGMRIDAGGVPVTVSTSELQEAYSALVAENPDIFRATREQVLAWHHQEALVCESAGALNAAQEHLNALIGATPAVDSLHARRSGLLAELGRWRDALAEAETSVALSGDDRPLIGTDGYRRALLHLATGDLAGYRRYCAEVLDRFAGTGDTQMSNQVAWTCALAPGAVPDQTRLVDLAKATVAAGAGNLAFLNTLGAVLCRAGRYEEAIGYLERSMAAQFGSQSPFDWLFLALAHQGLGHDVEARAWLDRSIRWLDEQVGEDGEGVRRTDRMGWEDRLVLSLLRQEVETLVSDAAFPANPFANAGASSRD